MMWEHEVTLFESCISQNRRCRSVRSNGGFYKVRFPCIGRKIHVTVITCAVLYYSASKVKEQLVFIF